MINVPIPQLIAALNFVFGRLLSQPLAGRGFWLLGALWNGVQIQCDEVDAVQTRRFFCSELSEAGPVIHGTSSPDQSPL